MFDFTHPWIREDPLGSKWCKKNSSDCVRLALCRHLCTFQLCVSAQIYPHGHFTTRAPTARLWTPHSRLESITTTRPWCPCCTSTKEYNQGLTLTTVVASLSLHFTFPGSKTGYNKQTQERETFTVTRPKKEDKAPLLHLPHLEQPTTQMVWKTLEAWACISQSISRLKAAEKLVKMMGVSVLVQSSQFLLLLSKSCSKQLCE